MRSRWRSEKISDATMSFSTQRILNFLLLSHTLRQPLSVIHDSKVLCPSRCSNLEVKKKSPLKGAGELRLKRETNPFMSPRCKCSMWALPRLNWEIIGLLGELSPFYREGTSSFLRHSVSVTFSLLLDIGLGIHWGCPLTRYRVACMPL